MPRNGWSLLFSEYDLRAVLDTQLQEVDKRVSGVPEQALVSNALESIVEALASQSRISPLVLHEAQISVEQDEARVDVSRDFDRSISDRSRPFHVDGLRVTYYLPYSGDHELLRCRPSSFTFNPPQAVIGKGELAFPYARADRNVLTTKAEFERELRVLKEWVGRLNQQVEAHNAALGSRIRQKLEARKQRIEEGKQQLGGLGFKVRQKPNIPDTPSQTRAKTSSPKGNPGRSSRRSKEFDVALSFAGENRTYVEQVATILRDRGVSVFYDGFEEVDMWGKNLADHLSDVYATRARFIVMFVSEHYARKAWPTLERQQAQARALKSQETVILPARFDDTEVPGLASTVAYADLRRLSPAQLADRIVQKIAHRG